MYRHFYFLLLLLFLSSPSFAQKEANIWYFGLGAGINFNYSPPKPLLNGQIYTREGVATISDKKTGKLLFYTEGTKVWDRTQQVMPHGNGLLGDYSSTQSAIIVPCPGKVGKYYIFTTALGKGMRYSEVDINQHGGFGDLIPATKNTLLIPENKSTEKIIAVRHCNGRDFWVVTHTLNNNAFYVFLVSKTGIHSPQIFHLGSVIHEGGGEVTSYLKFSPDGNLLANAFGNPKGGHSSKVELIKFDNKTGQLSVPVTALGQLDYPYGVEFSPDGNLLYVSTQAGRSIYQYNLKATNIAATRTQIVSSSHLWFGALQLGPNGKIYVSAENGFNNGYDYLGVINHPDSLGIACDFVQKGVYLGGKQTLIGLPTFLGSIFYHPEDFQFINTCLGDTTQFHITNTKNIDSVYWRFGDGINSRVLAPDHLYKKAGDYAVRLILYYPCRSDTVKKTITICSARDTTVNVAICEGETYQLPDGRQVSKAGIYISNSNNSCGCNIKVTTSLKVNKSYHITIKDSICPATAYRLPDGRVVSKSGTYVSKLHTITDCDSTIVTDLTVISYPAGDFQVTNTCFGERTNFYIPNTKNVDSVHWDFGDKSTSGVINPFHSYKNAGDYNIRLIIFYPCKSDTVQKMITICSVKDSTINAAICEGDNYLLPDSRRVSKAGIYISKYNNSCGCEIKITTHLKVNKPYHIVIKDTICPTTSYQLPDGRIVSEPGSYTSKFHTIAGCDSIIETQLFVKEQFRTQVYDTICRGSNIIFPDGREINLSGDYKVVYNASNGCDSMVMCHIKVLDSPIVVLREDFCIVPGEVVVLHPIVINGSPGWQDGSKKISFKVTKPGRYWINAKNRCGVASDTVLVTGDCLAKVFLPSAFTPNHDGQNDVFRILNVHGQQLLLFNIYDRWGEEVFHTNDILKGWTGQINGKKAQTGSYVYFIKLRNLFGEIKIIKGAVTLIR